MNNAMIAIIGAGNMGASLAGGLISKNYPREKIFITDPDSQKLSRLKEQFQIETTTDNHLAARQADVIILAVKPQIMNTVVQDLQNIFQEKKPLLISIAAGIREASIQKKAGGNMAIVRAMPNTPALIGCGATALYANSFVSSEQHSMAESILRAVSTVIWIEDESLMDTVTALSGSGPAYFFVVIEAMQKAAEELGLSADAARTLTLQTAYGAARMAMESDVDVEELRKRVTSPGGTTEEALRILEENKIHTIFKKALTAAKNRSKELAEIFDHPKES